MSRMRAFRIKIYLAAAFALAASLLFLKLGKHDIRATYEHDKLSLLARFVAKEYCTCLFVHEQTEAYCDDYIGTEIPLLGVRFNTSWITSYSVASPKISQAKTTASPEEVFQRSVRASALYFAKAEARYYGEKGCRLEP